jgi:Putative threonine efflux protein
MWHYIVKGFIIGLLTGMPLGPIGALCLKTTLTNGILYGLIAGLGSAIADSMYGFIAAFGVTAITHILHKHEHYVRLFGGLFVIFYGIKTILSKEEHKTEEINSQNLIKTFATTFFLALANPSTVFSFLVVFSAYGSSHLGTTNASRLFLVFGVFLGSAFWWVLLIAVANLYRSNLTVKKLKTINKALGSLIAISGIVIILSVSTFTKTLNPHFLHMKIIRLLSHMKII